MCKSPPEGMLSAPSASSFPLPFRRFSVRQFAQQLRPLLEDLVLHGVAGMSFYTTRS
jgi:hypothetical protein